MARGIKASNSTDSSQNGSTPQLPENQPTSSNRSHLTLPLNPLAIPIYNIQTREDVEADGEVLFSHYVQEEFEHEGISDNPLAEQNFEGGDATTQEFSQPSTSSEHYRPATVQQSGDTIDPSAAVVSTPDGYKNSTWTRYGRHLRELADRFSQSREGSEVRQQADNVTLEEINSDLFQNLLIELFSQGFSTVRLLALFYFCSRLLIRAAVEQRPDLCRSLFKWSLNYIRNKVCAWVYENGGWGKVLGSIYNIIVKVAIVTALVVGIVAGVVWIRKNW